MIVNEKQQKTKTVTTDGARSNRYAPYSPNSGFYYVRYNPRTLYFFSVFMRMGDSVIGTNECFRCCSF
jgi:hypothetical protein